MSYEEFVDFVTTIHFGQPVWLWLLAAPAVIDARDPLPRPLAYPEKSRSHGAIDATQDDAIAKALAHDGPALVEVMSDPDLV